MTAAAREEACTAVDCLALCSTQLDSWLLLAALAIVTPNLSSPERGEKLMGAVSHPQEERDVQDLGGKLSHQALCI